MNSLLLLFSIIEIKLLSIADLNGRIVKSLEVNQTSSQINVSDLASGTYILNMQFGDQVKSGKFVVTN